jgi:hypothetical protein
VGTRGYEGVRGGYGRVTGFLPYEVDPP